MALRPGTRLGPYEIVSLVGEGGMGEVYKATDTRLNRVVAIKFSKGSFSDRFKAEALAIAALNHPNVCHLYDVGENYIVMEFVDGEPIRPMRGTRKQLELAVQVADGLAAAHAREFIHRDLKPDNILQNRDGRVKILDFGLAKKSVLSPDDETAFMTAAKTIVGTPAYMSPEQAGGMPLDRHSDQFSFGLILYELIAGKHAFRRASTAQTMAAIMQEDHEPLPASVPTQVRAIVDRCLQKDPGERYDSTRDLYLELKHVRDDFTELTTSTHHGAHGDVRRGWHTHLIWAGVLLAAITAIVVWPVNFPRLLPVMPLATESDLQTMARWSPAGDRIAYVAPVNGMLQVFEKSIGHATPTQITYENQSCFLPFWSSDGRRVYFITGTQSHTNLRSVAVAGGPSEMVLPGAYRADLSPDGSTLAALMPVAPGSYTLAFSSPPGSPAQHYSGAPLSGYRTNGVSGYLRYDRSGKFLGLSTVTPQVVFWRIPLGTGGVPEPFKNNYLVSFDWVDDGRRIVADSSISGADDQLSIRELGTDRRWNLTAGSSKINYPAIARDGHSLALTSGEAAYKLVQISLDGSSIQPVTATSRSEAAPSWSPDGNRFAFATNRNGKPEIWLRNRSDQSERRIVGSEELPDTIAFYDCEISPDGTRVAYRQQRSSGGVILISPLTGETPVRLWDDPAGSSQRGPSWSPDGNAIAYYGVRDGRVALMKARVGGNSPPEFLAFMDAQQPVRWSPRSDWIAFSDGRTLRTIRSNGKDDRVVSQHSWETYGWAPNGNILGIFTDQNRRESLARIDVTSKKETFIADIGSESPAVELAITMNQIAYRGFSMDPKGGSFLTSVITLHSEIDLIHDFDRPIRLIRLLFGRPQLGL